MTMQVDSCDALIDSALSLNSLPRRGGMVVGRPGILKLVHPPYYLIFYRIDERMKLVEILRFWDGRRDPEGLRIPQ